jgi:hypothetical protein
MKDDMKTPGLSFWTPIKSSQMGRPESLFRFTFASAR